MSAPAPAVIELEGVHKHYDFGRGRALRVVRTGAGAGAVWVLPGEAGANGCGTAHAVGGFGAIGSVWQ